MAVWQFDLYLIPATTELPSGGFETAADWAAESWNGKDPPLLEHWESLSRSLSCERTGVRDGAWGLQDSNCVFFGRGDEGPEGAHIRVDARSVDSRFLQAVCDLARSVNALFVTPDWCLLEPYPDALARAVAGSPARRFVEDPVGFLEDLADSSDTDGSA